MQIEKSQEETLSWKKLDNNIYATHFLSRATELGYKPSQIYVKKFEATKKDPKKNITIILLHDICQYHGRFQHFINWMREHNPGVSFIAMDFQGHGLSSGTRGHFFKFNHLATDLYYLLDQLEKNNDELEKWIVLGHGLGGMVALDLLSRFQMPSHKSIDGVILSNFILTFPSALLQLESQLSSSQKILNKFLSRVRPIKYHRGEDILTSPDDVLMYEQDPLVLSRPTLNTIREIQKRVEVIYQDSYFLDKPLMILKSEMGIDSKNEGISYFAKGIKKELLCEKSYSHMKYDLYNEYERVAVFKEITDWMKLYEK